MLLLLPCFHTTVAPEKFNQTTPFRTNDIQMSFLGFETYPIAREYWDHWAISNPLFLTKPEFVTGERNKRILMQNKWLTFNQALECLVELAISSGGIRSCSQYPHWSNGLGELHFRSKHRFNFSSDITPAFKPQCLPCCSLKDIVFNHHTEEKSLTM